MAKMNYDAINFKNKDVDRFSTKFGNGDPIKLKNSPLSGTEFNVASNGKGDPLANAHYMASTARSASDRSKAMDALKKEDPGALESYGYKKTKEGNVVDPKRTETIKDDARRLREMANRRSTNTGEAVNTSNRGLRQRKLDEGIQLPSMTKAKKPIILAPTINTKKK
jgi:hypothetical protein